MDAKQADGRKQRRRKSGSQRRFSRPRSGARKNKIMSPVKEEEEEERGGGGHLHRVHSGSRFCMRSTARLAITAACGVDRLALVGGRRMYCGIKNTKNKRKSKKKPSRFHSKHRNRNKERKKKEKCPEHRHPHPACLDSSSPDTKRRVASEK